MGSIPVSRPEPRRRFDARKVVMPLGAAAVLIAMAIVMAYFLTQSSDPSVIAAGDVDDFATGEPVHFEDDGFFVVKLESGEVIALSDVDPRDHLVEARDCRIAWLPNFEFADQTGWFRDPCYNSTYATNGEVVFGPTSRSMDRYEVSVLDGEVRVDTDERVCAPMTPAERCPY